MENRLKTQQKSTGKKLRRRNAGYALIIAVFLMPILYMIAATTTSKFLIDLDITRREIAMKQAYYIAESGQAVAYYLFSLNNYQLFTHYHNGTTVESSRRIPIPDSLKENGVNLTIDTEGWYTWQWKPGDATLNLTGSRVPEKYRFRIYNPEIKGNNWVIESEGIYDNTNIRKIELRGITESAFSFALFGAKNQAVLGEGEEKSITGKIHANQTLFLSPAGSTLKLNASSITAAEDIITGWDPWGRHNENGQILIRSGGTDNYPRYERLNRGSAVNVDFDPAKGPTGTGTRKDNPDWRHSQKGALSLWKGKILDGTLGMKRYDTIPRETLQEDSYYHRNASMIIGPDTPDDSRGVIKTIIFYNQATRNKQTIKEIDFEKLENWTDYKTRPKKEGGGIVLYCRTPIRIKNASVLPDRILIASNSEIYIKGDFNKDFGNRESLEKYYQACARADRMGTDPATIKINDYMTKKPASVISGQRIWFLSAGFTDERQNKPPDEASSFKNLTPGEAVDRMDPREEVRWNNLKPDTIKMLTTFHERFREQNDVLELNGAFVDAAPFVSERKFVNYSQIMTKEGTLEIKKNKKREGTAIPGSRPYLEQWGKNRKVRIRGAIVNLQDAVMAEFDNSNAGPGICPWIIDRTFEPPTLELIYDPSLSNQDEVPLGMNLGKKLTRKIVR